MKFFKKDYFSTNNNSQKRLLNFIVFTPIILLVSISSIASPNILGLLLVLTLLGVIVLYFKDIYTLIFVVIFISMNNQLLRVNFNLKYIGISVQVICYLLVFLCLSKLVCEKRLFKNIGSMLVPLWFYVIWYIYLVIVNIIKVGFSFNILINILFYFLIGIIIQILVASDKKYCKKLIITYFLSIIVIVTVGYTELIMGKTFFLSQWAMGERYRYGILRIGSTVADGNYISALLLPAYILFKTKAFGVVINKTILKISQVFIFIQIILTLSRTGLILLIFANILIIAYKYKKYILLWVPVVLIVPILLNKIILALYNVDGASNSAREMINNLSYSLWQENFWIGLGFGQFTQYSSQYTDSKVTAALENMNTYYYILTSVGTIGLIFYFINIYYSIRKNIMSINKDIDSAYIIIAILIWSIIIYTLDCFSIVFLWIIPPLILAIQRIKSRGELSNNKINLVIYEFME